MVLNSVQTNYSMSLSTGSGGLPLDEFTANVPPKLRLTYPVKMYLEKMRLWYRQTPLTEMSQIGRLVAGRLKGKAYTFAMKLKVQLETKH